MERHRLAGRNLALPLFLLPCLLWFHRGLAILFSYCDRHHSLQEILDLDRGKDMQLSLSAADTVCIESGVKRVARDFLKEKGQAR